MKLLCFLCLAVPALCQPTFTVASVKSTEFHKPSILVDPGRISFSSVTLHTLITRAYSVQDYQVRGPDWIANTAYTVQATMPAGTPEAEVWQMLQTLLTERFQLVVRRTQAEIPVYALEAAKNGPKLKDAAGGAPSVKFTGGAIHAKNATVGSLVKLLGVMLDRPVVDHTGLAGAYDFTLAFGPDGMLGPGMKKMSLEMELAKTEAAGGSIFTAIQEQLGLKLQPRKAPIDVIVVEKALKTPVEN